MSTGLAARAELMKLARLLDVEPEELEYLDSVPPPALARFREQVTEMLFDRQGHALGRLAAASRLLPTGVVAAIAEGPFGPLLAARLAGLLEPHRAAEVAEKLSPAFLAQAAVYLDPRRTAALLSRIPPSRIAEAARDLAAAGEYVTLGGFVGHLPAEALAQALAELDDLAVLQVGFLLEDVSAIERVLGLLKPHRVENLLDSARGSELWSEVLELVNRLDAAMRARLLGGHAGSEGGARGAA